jgi:hypothetical protein
MAMLYLSNFAINLTHMKTERVQKRESLPKWQLYANFILRELACLCYGEKSVFDLDSFYYGDEAPYWEYFRRLFGSLIWHYGDAHGISAEELNDRMDKVYKELEKWQNMSLRFRSPSNEAIWFAMRVLGEEEAKEFFSELEVKEIINTIANAYVMIAQGKEPPYTDFVILRPLAYYEALLVAPELNGIAEVVKTFRSDIDAYDDGKGTNTGRQS